MRQIHDTFHFSLLDPVKSTTLPAHSQPPVLPALYVKDDQEFFEIQDILDSKRDRSSCRIPHKVERLSRLRKFLGASRKYPCSRSCQRIPPPPSWQAGTTSFLCQFRCCTLISMCSGFRLFWISMCLISGFQYVSFLDLFAVL